MKVVLGPSVSLQVQYKIKGPGDKFVPIRGGFVCLVFVLDHVKWDPAPKNTASTIQVKLPSLEVKRVHLNTAAARAVLVAINTERSFRNDKIMVFFFAARIIVEDNAKMFYLLPMLN